MQPEIKSVRAINKAYEENRMVAVLSQKDIKQENPGADEIYQTGTIARIIKLLRLPDGTATAILHGKRKFRLVEMTKSEPYLEGKIEILPKEIVENQMELDAMVVSIKDMANEIIQLSPNIPTEATVMLKNIRHSSFLLNFIASNLAAEVKIKQQILESTNLNDKAQRVLAEMDNELRLLELKDQIESKVRGDLEKQQRDYFLNQQLKTIQEELGQNPQQEEIKRDDRKSEGEKMAGTCRRKFSKRVKKSPTY